MNDLIENLASSLHDKWREARIMKDGSYEPRLKKTNDEEWIEQHGTNQVDIANTPYKDLPEDWQAENEVSAEIAVTLAQEGTEVEKAASIIHEKWLERNADWAPAGQKCPYEELSKEDKEKDRMIIREAYKLVNN